MNKKKDSIIAANILIIFTLLMSQNITWRLILFITNGEDILKKTIPIIQLSFSSLYVFFAIIMTSDKDIFMKYIEIPVIKRFLNKIMKITFKIASWVINFLLALLVLFSINDDEIPKLALKTKEYTKNLEISFNSQILELRILSAIMCFFMLIFIISFSISLKYISYIADIFSLFPAIMGGFFLSKNARENILKREI